MTQKLLFADDSLTMHRVVAITFGQENVTLVAAHSGAEALAHGGQMALDAALIDVHLGDMDGYALCARLQQLRGGQAPLPVLLLVSEQHPVDNDKLRACGALGTVKKPFDTQTLVARVREAMARGVPSSLSRQSVPKTQAAPTLAPAKQGQDDHGAPPRPAFFQMPPPLPPPPPNKSHEGTGWTVSQGGPPATSTASQNVFPQGPNPGHGMPRAQDLPEMPRWNIDGDPAPQKTPANVPLWSEKESVTAEDLRRPEIDPGVTHLARTSDPSQAVLQAQTSSQAPAGLQAGAAPEDVVAPITQALHRALGQLPETTAQALGANFAASLAPVLAQAIERAVWDILPTLAERQVRAYFEAHPPRG